MCSTRPLTLGSIWPLRRDSPSFLETAGQRRIPKLAPTRYLVNATEIRCPSCKTAIAPVAFLSACSDYWSVADTVKFTCPTCHAPTDARVEEGQVSLGYIYAAGGPHYCGMEEVSVPDLSVWRDGESLVSDLHGVERRIEGTR